MELIVIHLLTHEVPIAILSIVGMLIGRRQVFKHVRRHDPIVQELRAAADDALPFVGYAAYVPEKADRLLAAIKACEECTHSHR